MSSIGSSQNALSAAEATVGAPGLLATRWHYRVIDVKFTGLKLDKHWHAASDHLAYMVQTFIYNEALGRIQGYLPPSSYLLGRGWTKGANDCGSTNCMDRLASVPHSHQVHDRLLSTVASEAVDWMRKVCSEGSGWDPRNAAGVSELRPSPKNLQNYPWHAAVAELAGEHADITLAWQLSFMIGCGHIEGGEWQFSSFIANRLDTSCEADIIEHWLAHMESVRERVASEVARPLVFHWSPAETSSMSGAQALRRYLEYAAAPATAIQVQQAFDPDAETETPFEDAVAAGLRARGHRVQPQVGVAGYRIDLGIYSIDGTRFDVGVECDGATYHSSPAARDRDWLRQSVLEDLGWVIHRVWSTSWLQNPAAELVLIENALAEARLRQPGAVGWRPSSPAQAADAGEDQDFDPGDPSQPESTGHLFVEYVEASISRLPIGADLRLETDRTLAPLILAVVGTEGPVHFELIVERLRLRYRLSRVREEARTTIRLALDKLENKGGLLSGEEDFYHIAGQEVRPRRPGRAARRHVAHISLAELEAGTLAVLGVVTGPTSNDLVRETARHFGYGRTGSEIKISLDQALELMVEAGEVHIATDGTVRPGKQT
ncbi:MAG: hypothetical protein ABIQ47_14680 [Tepidiformaceae bacterium]